MFFALVIAFAVPFIGFLLARMDDFDTGKKMPVRDSVYYGVGCALGGLGIVSFLVWLITWMWSISTETPSTVIDLNFCLAYAVVTTALGGLVMGFTHPRHN